MTADVQIDRDVELPAERFSDRELSWLAFNNRVLDLARDDARVPLLERARFLAIFTSNLDEFFMVRVAGLKRRIAAGVAVASASGSGAAPSSDDSTSVSSSGRRPGSSSPVVAASSARSPSS